MRRFGLREIGFSSFSHLLRLESNSPFPRILFSKDSFMRVLVVEDYDPIRSAVVQALTEEGYAVDSTDNGRDGLWHAKSAEHDVIVLDILLPHVSGIEILQTLRSSNNHVPVLLLTALDEVDQPPWKDPLNHRPAECHGRRERKRGVLPLGRDTRPQ